MRMAILIGRLIGMRLSSFMGRSYLVLQFPMASQAATLMAVLGDLLMAPSPAGPRHDLGERCSRAGRGPDESNEQPADLRDRNRDMARAPARAEDPPFV